MYADRLRHPGIGKPMFGYYCIYRALMDGKRVVYRTSQLEMWWFVYDRCSVSTLSEMPFALLQDFENVIYISDSLRPFNVPCPTILVTFPRRDIWFGFNKLATCKLKWFGVWDRDHELDLLHYHCFSSISVDDMDRKVKLWR